MVERRPQRAGRVVFWLGAAMAFAAAGRAEAQVTAAVETVRPGRAHLVAAGTPTTFVLTLNNATAAARELVVRVDSSVDAVSLLRPADGRFQPTGAGAGELRLTLAPQSRAHVLAWITPNAGLPNGQQGHTLVSAWDDTTALGSFDLGWKISGRPKLFYVVLDALGSRYLGLNRVGRPRTITGAAGALPRLLRRSPPWAREPLMPRSLEFLGDAAFFPNARAVLPATTDPNHLAALTGSWPGTNGIHSVASNYGGLTAQGRPITLQGAKELLRTGAQGTAIRTVFDVARDAQAGGSPDGFNMMFSGKSWMCDLVRDTATMDFLGSGAEFPSYVPPPQKMRLGDPPSDPDASKDREGTNLGPRPILKIHSTQALLTSQNPERVPDDRWVAEGVMRAIMAEDPDVAYVVLSEVDTVQHVFGAADRPEEWTDTFATPNVLWDDTNIYNAAANRDPILDVVHEADIAFGMILDTLRVRQAFDRSFVVLMSDHSQVTEMKGPLDVSAIVGQIGVSPQDVERIISSGEQAAIYLTDPSRAAAVETLLEAYEVVHPVTGQAVKPFLVLTRAEMDTGADTATGPVLEDGIGGNSKGEVYSQWSIEAPPTPDPRVRWPDLFLFNRYRFQNLLTRTDDLDGGLFGLQFNGHHGSPQANEVTLAIAGPRIRGGVYDTQATLADVLPTLYPLMGLAPPSHVDGHALSAIVAPE